MTPLETTLGYTFENTDLITQALTHPSFFSAKKERLKINHFERLEFIGDRILGVIMGTWLYKEFSTAPEGELSRRLAHLVRRETLAQISEEMGINIHLKYSRADEKNQSQWLTLLADACEALIGAIYLDSGLASCERIIKKFWASLIHAKDMDAKDPKTLLQEYAHTHLKTTPSYIIAHTEGPSHAPKITVKCTLNDLVVSATSSNKKAAAIACAQQLLTELNTQPLK